MGKHNGKARSAGGLKVGSALVNRAAKGGPRIPSNPNAQYLHTTDVGGLQSNLEANDLTELMDMAQLAGRDFTAERGSVVVVSNGAVDAMDKERSLAKRQEAEARNAHRLKVPRRPHWTPEMTAEAVDAHERAAFVRWRRELALLEEEEKLVMTPFEKNLEVWRQLWRVLERSHIVVQVVDARDPLMYHSKDLEAYARELQPTKASVVLLNKADLLTKVLRTAWADYFDAQGVNYAFWSAKAAAEGTAGQGRGGIDDPRVRVLTCDELIEMLEQKAQEAVDAGADVPRYGATAEHPEGRLMVGLTGYPNVGKSSTINALFGSKKTTVSSTPGKTKHFQTLNINPRLTLVDCPGLVLPRYAASKAEMVAAGVIPIDRLTDVRAPVAVIAERVPQRQLEEVYGIRLPAPAAHEAPDRPPTSAELLRATAVARGWSSANGLPDETRAGRMLLKDFTSGKLLFAEMPPGFEAPDSVPFLEQHAVDGGQHAQPSSEEEEEGTEEDGGEAGQPSSSSQEVADGAVDHSSILSTSGQVAMGDLGDADLDLIEALRDRSGKVKPKRPEYKFHKKPARSKGSRGKADDGTVVYDGSAMKTGKHGGLVRVS